MWSPGASGGPGIRAVTLALVVAICAGALAVYAPIPGVVLGVVAIGTVLLNDRPLPDLGRVGVGVMMVAAIIGPNLFVPGAEEMFLFRVISGLIALGLVVWVVMGRGVPVPGGLGIPVGVVAGWWGIGAVSILWATSTADAFRWTLFLVMMTGLMLAIPVAASNRRRLAWFLGALGIAFAVAVVVAFAEITTGIRLPTSALAERVGAFAATSFFGNQNNFATYLSLTLPYLLVLPVVVRDLRLRLLGAIGAICAIGFILVSGSKANLVAVGIILLGLLAVLATDRTMRRGLTRGLVLVSVALLLIIPSLFGRGIVPLPDQAVTKLDFGTLTAQVESGSGSGAVRRTLLGTGIDLVIESRGVGVGAGNAEAAVRETAGYEGVANLHNWTLEVLVDTGIVGFVLYAALYVFMLVGNLRVARRTTDPWLRYMGLAGALALLGFLMGGLGPSTAIHFAPMWITFGLCLTTIVMARRAEPNGPVH